MRPSSEVYYNHQQSHNQNNNEDAVDRAAQQWLSDIDQYETTLEEMAAATLDQDFKDELSAIEQWFRVLSEAERTAALYALLQQTTQVQIRFFIQVLQQMAKSHPMSGLLSPANFGEKGMLPYTLGGGASVRGLKDSSTDAMSNRLNDAMSKLNVDSSRNSLGRPPTIARCQTQFWARPVDNQRNVPRCRCGHCQKKGRVHATDWQRTSIES